MKRMRSTIVSTAQSGLKGRDLLYLMDFDRNHPSSVIIHLAKRFTQASQVLVNN